MTTPKKEEEKHISFHYVKMYLLRVWNEVIDLDKGVDFSKTIAEVKAKQSMAGANAWMLMCSIMIASIGLNLNSEAVIIGAMLISPLMSPILGIGVSVGVNDKDGLYNALKHFGAAVFIALFTSTLYFFISPLDEFTEQISARTEPTFLDILIGTFGGIAGIISVARKDISTTLPGVAIATALMPPLCVTGYGIANGSWEILSKSFYLFFLNSFFVALSTYAFVRLMHFPDKTFTTRLEKRKNIIIIGLVCFIMTIPSFIIFTNVYKRYNKKERINSFVKTYIGDLEIYLDDFELVEIDKDSDKLIMKVYGDSINRSKIAYYEEGLRKLDMPNTKVEIIPTSEINLTKIRQLEKELSDVGTKVNTQLEQLAKEKDAQTEILNQLRSSQVFLSKDTSVLNQVCDEIKIFIPEIESIDLSSAFYTDFNSTISNLPTVVVKWAKPEEMKVDQLKKFLIERFQLDTVKLVVEREQ